MSVFIFIDIEGDEVEPQQHSQEKSIYHLKQEMLSLTDEQVLMSGSQELRYQLSVKPVKEEGTTYNNYDIV